VFHGQLLFTRVFRVNLDTLDDVDRAFRSLAGQGERNSVEAQPSTIELLQSFLKRAGVDFSTNAMPIGPAGLPQPTGKALFWSERTGSLLVRATMTDIEKIERAMKVLNDGA
jgi:hypothetical protein